MRRRDVISGLSGICAYWHCRPRLPANRGPPNRLAGPSGATMPALPLPIDPQFRDDSGKVKQVPKLGGE
jgi:hypothetical protein